ncbi:hypothetical protein LEM8419_00636 [Neolewinella maritima]|uniref:3-oxoacyl-ACP synthase n=1 Tax=Neolewinella maritima TaxID=1383882 RepID=A0ABM9AYG1_9BACT|nr:GreA/GreB family elongation factor [Neolewinella maritima]CAH0999338.1 hypothetical protein LEM8419_00636 [Neolewinella maritima]
MMDSHEVKAALYQACTEHIERTIRTITQNLTSIDASRSSETKSSAGDKFETGRAMLHLEEQNNQRQLSEILQVKHALGKIDPAHSSPRIQTGSLIITDRGTYYLAVGLGKVTLAGSRYYCISPQSPIGGLLLHKTVGDEVHFNGKPIKIQGVR